MPQTTYEKSANPRGIVYDAGQIFQFPTQNLIVNQTTSGTISSQMLVLPASIKIFGAAIVGVGTPTGFTSFNLVLGVGAETGSPTSDNSEIVGWPPTVAAAGNQLFAVDQPVTLVNNVPQTFAASVPDAIWPKGALLTLRYNAGASVGGQFFVSLFYKIFDTQPQAPGKFNRPLAYADM